MMTSRPTQQRFATKTTRQRWAISACALLLLTLPWQGAWAYDLTQAYKDAQTNDAPLASARAQLVATREKIPQARSVFYPQINGTAGATEQLLDTTTNIHRNWFAPTVGMGLTMPLFRPANNVALDQSKLVVQQAENALVVAEQDLMIRVSTAYFDVLAAEDVITFIQTQKKAIAEQLASAKRNFEVGTQTITDQQEAQARFDLTNAQEISAQNDLDTKRALLALIVGKSPDALAKLVRNVDLVPPLPNDENAWTSTARSGSFAVAQAKLQSDIAKLEIDRNRMAHYPGIDLVGNGAISRTAQTTPTPIVTRTAGVGVQLSVPIFTGGLLTSRVKEAAALYDKSQRDLTNAERTSDQAARQLFKAVKSLLAQVRALEAAERSSQLALDSNLLGYQVGVRVNIDVLNAQQQLYATRRDLARARYDVLVNGLKLKQAAGNLAEADITAVNRVLQ